MAAAVQQWHAPSLMSLVVTVGVTCQCDWVSACWWPWGDANTRSRHGHGVRGTEDCSCLRSQIVWIVWGSIGGGIVIAVGQDEYDAIDAADQVTPELITSQRQVSAEFGADQSVYQSISPSCRQSDRAADRVFPAWLTFVFVLLAFGF